MLKDKLRMVEWLLFGLFLLAVVALLAPAQIPVVLYKGSLVTLFAHLGYWIARRLAPYARPDESVAEYYRTNMLCRTIIVAAVIVAGALAL